MRKPLAEEPKPQGFNLQVTYRDEQTGLVTHSDPYVLRVIDETGSGDKRELFERPKGSGNLFDKQNNPVGRWVYGEEKIIKGKKVRVGSFVPDAQHIAFTPPPTEDQLLARQLSEKDVKIAELERELKAIQSEKSKKAEAPKKDQGA